MPRTHRSILHVIPSRLGTLGLVMHFGMMLAVGAVDATYRVDYQNYKEAAVTYKVK